MIPSLLVAGFLGFLIGAASQPGPIALAAIFGGLGMGIAFAGWWAEHVEGIEL